MKNHALKLLLVSLLTWTALAEDIGRFQETADAIVSKAQTTPIGWARLSTLCTLFPHRLSGSQGLEQAIDWIEGEMKADGFDSVYTEAVMVPHWERGREELTVLGQTPQSLQILGLGGSVSTPPGGIEAELVVVESYEELERRHHEVAGKIVVFNVPFTTYGETVGYRFSGASRAADAGAKAALLRSVAPYSLDTPHTGVTVYSEKSEKIPFGAISPEAAMRLHRVTERGEKVRVRLVLESTEHLDAPSRNLVAEIRGREIPEEVIVIGGHIDGWDVGEGAHDDAGGSVMCWEALRVLADMGLRPRRTIRVVLWTNEENGLQGGKTYRRLHDLEVKNHVLAIESDYGTFHPSGFGYSGPKEGQEVLASVLYLLKTTIGEMAVRTPGGGADIGPLMDAGVPGAGLTHSSEKYFWYHHSPADTLDKIDPVDFRNCVATLAVTAFVVAELEQRIPFGKPKLTH